MGYGGLQASQQPGTQDRTWKNGLAHQGGLLTDWMKSLISGGRRLSQFFAAAPASTSPPPTKSTTLSSGKLRHSAPEVGTDWLKPPALQPPDWLKPPALQPPPVRDWLREGHKTQRPPMRCTVFAEELRGWVWGEGCSGLP